MKSPLFIVLAALTTIALVSCGVPSAPDFAKKATKATLYQVAAGKIAIEKGQSDSVKQFGRDMVETFGKIGDAFKGIVQAEKLAVDLPAQFDQRQQKWIGALSGAPPENFDKTYAQLQVRALSRAAEVFDRYAEGGSNQALRQFAANALTLINQHLEQAKKLPQ